MYDRSEDLDLLWGAAAAAATSPHLLRDGDKTWTLFQRGSKWTFWSAYGITGRKVTVVFVKERQGFGQIDQQLVAQTARAFSSSHPTLIKTAGY